MALAPSASGPGRHLLSILLVAMILMVAAFIILTASAHAGAESPPYKALYAPDMGLRTTRAAMPRNAFDQGLLAKGSTNSHLLV
jgi:hypothetical protein